jgi:hypothetical protein
MLAGLMVPVPAVAQDNWNPFAEPAPPASTTRRPPRPVPEPGQSPLAPMDGMRGPALTGEPPFRSDLPGSGAGGAPFAPREAVEKADLEPIAGPQGSEIGAPPVRRAETGGDAAGLARLMAGLPVPSTSPALTRLFVRVVAGDGGAGASASGESAGERAVRAEILFRAGRMADADAVVRAAGGTMGDPLLMGIGSRIALARGDRDTACRDGQAALQARDSLPKSIRGSLIGIQGYCAAAQGNAPAASLAAALAREDGGGLAEQTLAALDAVGVGERVRLDGTGRISVIDWRLLELSGEALQRSHHERLEPAALAAIAEAGRVPVELGVAAAEAAARINAIDAAVLAEAYRRHPFTSAELEQAQAAGVPAGLRRALLVRAAERERTPFKRTRLVRAAIDDARRAGLYAQIAAMLERTVMEIQPVSEIGWFAETAVEVMVAAGRPEQARRWAQFGADQGGGIAHWLALIDIADATQLGQRGASLASVEELALRGRFTADGLHRLATVLDALDYHVPMRLWEAASRAPQPTTGHLPATGVLSDLQDASRRKDLVRTMALVFQALGGQGPEAAHMIALGDAVRALRRAGLEREARAVATEALLHLWPRGTSS